jgi:hypothetical protein
MALQQFFLFTERTVFVLKLLLRTASLLKVCIGSCQKLHELYHLLSIVQVQQCNFIRALFSAVKCHLFSENLF